MKTKERSKVKILSKDKQQFTEDVKTVLKRVDHRSGHTEIRVMQWLIDGQAKGGIRLEKRAYHKRANAEGEYMGRCMGLSKEDLDYIVDNWADVRLFFE